MSFPPQELSARLAHLATTPDGQILHQLLRTELQNTLYALVWAADDRETLMRQAEARVLAKLVDRFDSSREQLRLLAVRSPR